MRKLAIALIALMIAGSTGGCSTTASPSVAGPATAASIPVPAPSVLSLTLTIDDPKLGHLTFDALAAGDPDAARHGKLVLFLHGFPTTDESYREILPVVAREGYYAVAYSQRGYSPGARPAAVDDYNILALVGDLARVADSLGADHFHIVGHDWGGAVAWVAAVLLPNRIESLMALSTPHPDALSAGIADPTDPQSRASAYMRTLREPGSEDRLLAPGVDGFSSLFDIGAGGLPNEKVDRYAEALANPDALRAVLDWYRANPLPTPAPVGPVTVPTVYLWGADDAAFVRSAAEATAAHVIGPYTFIELPDHGHWLPEDAPDQIVAALLPLLAGHPPGGAAPARESNPRSENRARAPRPASTETIDRSTPRSG